jgi:PBP1b-binding outer membrane lipoprotein LpoB
MELFMLRTYAVKLSLAVSAGAMLMSGCSGPIATRIASEGRVPAQQEARFMLLNAPGESSSIEQRAQTMIISGLNARGWNQDNDNANYALSISLSERPATIGITAKSTDNTQSKVISAPKKNKPLQSCDDVEQRLNIALVRLSDGARVFRGNAAEYHCKAGLEETLPYLVNAALSGLDNPGTNKVQEREGRE